MSPHATRTVLGPILSGMMENLQIWFHPWIRPNDRDYNVTRIGSVKIRDLESLDANKLSIHAPALSENEWKEVLEYSKSIYDLHFLATKKVLSKINPWVKYEDLRNWWMEKKNTFPPGLVEVLRDIGSLKYHYYLNEWYPDTPLLLILLALDGINHHISGVAMYNYVSDPKVKAWYEDEGNRLLNIFSEYGYKFDEGGVVVFVYPPIYPEDVGFKLVSARSGSSSGKESVKEIYYKGGELSQYTLLLRYFSK
jgi:hypothetical protein